MNKYTWIIIFMFVCVVLLFCFFTTLVFPETGYNFLGDKKKVELKPGHPVIQTFTAEADNLTALRVVLGNTEVLNHNSHLRFQLLDEECAHILAEEVYQSGIVQALEDTFHFPLQPDSAGRTYCFAAMYEAPQENTDGPILEADEDERWTLGSTGYIDTDKGKNFPDRRLKIRPAYASDTVVENTQRLFDRLSQYKPDFFKTPYVEWLSVATVLGILLLGSGILLL